MVKDGRNRILQESFIKEMDSIIGPLESRAGRYKNYEPLYLQDNDRPKATAFWENIKKNKFLAPENLRLLIENYLTIFEEQEKELRKTRYEIRESRKEAFKKIQVAANDDPMITKSKARDGEQLAGTLVSEHINALIRIAPSDEGYGTYVKDLENIIAFWGPELDLSKKMNYFRELSQEGYIYRFARNDRGPVIDSIINTRSTLEAAVKQRYSDLEQCIEELRAESEKNLKHGLWQFWK